MLAHGREAGVHADVAQAQVGDVAPSSQVLADRPRVFGVGGLADARIARHGRRAFDLGLAFDIFFGNGKRRLATMADIGHRDDVGILDGVNRLQRQQLGSPGPTLTPYSLPFPSARAGSAWR